MEYESAPKPQSFRSQFLGKSTNPENKAPANSLKLLEKRIEDLQKKKFDVSTLLNDEQKVFIQKKISSTAAQVNFLQN